MGKELEYKLAAEAPAELDRLLEDPRLRSMMSEPVRTYNMRTTYYDTPSRRFAALRYTVRRRMENRRSVLCVKAPVAGASDAKLRSEWELEGEDMAAALPRLIAMGAPAELMEAAAEGLVPVCGAAFTRRAVNLELPDGSVCELACDLGELFGGEEAMPLCEAELELKHGGSMLTSRLAEELCRRFRLRPEPRSKYSRAKELR